MGYHSIPLERHRMSLEALSAVLHHSHSTGTARAVLTALAWHLGDDPEEGCYPSQSRLASLAGCSVRQVQRNLQKLVELGEVEMSQHDGIGYRFDRITNRYWIQIDCPEGCDGTLSHKLRGVKKGKTGRHLRLIGVTPTTSRDGVDVALKLTNN
ncbi:Helix-turn-helix domain containing protein [uncultured Caudovirales phage]|uniref:Helix-turn-helix domain containing protein n=2 Tax=root TaxID=1 RepID=A0A6J5MWH5_9CAUD|nr:Helix-turn-helix domain containing protein [uncultured Caudovirales phage]